MPLSGTPNYIASSCSVFSLIARCFEFFTEDPAYGSVRRPRLEPADVHLAAVDDHRARLGDFNPDLTGGLDSADRLGDDGPRVVGELAHVGKTTAQGRDIGAVKQCARVAFAR